MKPMPLDAMVGLLLLHHGQIQICFLPSLDQNSSEAQAF